MRCRVTRAWLLCAVLLTGCAAPPYVALGVDGVSRVDGALVGDTELFDVLRVGAPGITQDGSGRLQLQLPVHSLDEEPLDVLADVRFVDVAGGTVPGGAVRRHLRLLPGEPASCDATAPDSAAVAVVVTFDWDR